MIRSISIVVTAPSGLEECAYLSELLARADGKMLEVVVADASPNHVDQSRPGLRHLWAPGCGIQGLITEGIRQAECEWVLVTEDHCRPLPGLLEEYREAIHRNPDIDLFSGSAANQTSTSPWSFAIFMSGLGEFWSRAPVPPTGASNANLLIRRSAITPSELACDGGLLNVTVPRLMKSGRHKHCAKASVDHVLHLSPAEAVKFSFHCNGNATAVRRETLPARPMPIQIIRDFAGIFYLATIVPWRTAIRFRGTPHASLAMTLRLMLLGFARGLSILAVDMNRLRAWGRHRISGAN